MIDQVSRLLTAFYGTPWAILPDRLAAMRMVLQRWESGVRLDAAQLHAAIGNAPQAADERRQRAANTPGSVAVIPVYGILAPRIHQVSDVSGEGAMTYERLKMSLRTALADDSIGAIVLDIDSPGGSATGCMEIADEIYGARAQKKVVAVANNLAASAAYWLGAACEELIVTPSGEVGCIGVFGVHEDYTKWLEEMGLQYHVFRSAKFKAEGMPFEPLSEEAAAHIQSEVERIDASFTNAIAKYRGVKASVVRSDFGEGRCVDAQAAKSRGMVDRIDTLDNTIARLASSAKAQRPRDRQAAALRLAELS